jgi:catechol 2,3-dioxygenase-like lactoylglutathione lyase family enzyme
MPVETLTFDQVHLGVPDPEAAAQWYVKHLGAAPGEHVDRIWSGPTRIIFLRNPAPAPSRGAAIDHFAFSCADVAAELRALEGSGARVTTPVTEAPGLGNYAFIEDPWGAHIQLVEETGPLRVQHVHLHVPDPDLTRSWYVERFGGERATLKGRLDGIRYGDVWLFLERGSGTPSRGHTIDHIGWRMPNLLAKAAELKTKGGWTFTKEPHPGPAETYSPVLMSFAEDPWGVKIELLQRRDE